MKQFRIERKEQETSNGIQFTAICFRATPKGRNKEKVVFAYRFRDEEHRENYINEFLSTQERREAEREADKQKRINAKKNLANPYKVGDILYDSWGYDQTNIDFYQVVEVGAKSIKMQPIGQKYLGDAGFMCEYVAPLKDGFTDEPVTKILQITRDGTVYITSRHGWISKWDREKIYQSHYA